MKKYKKLFTVEIISAILLFFFAGLALYMTNSSMHDLYYSITHFKFPIKIGSYFLQGSTHLIVNDILMTVFFFVVGMEIKKELIDGEISTPKKASLPLIAAIGGFILPSIIYYFFNHNLDTSVGWAIPTATDIAFALGAFYVIGKRVPVALKIFLLCLAIIDDVLAVLVIAVFYSDGISGPFLATIVLTMLAIYFYFKLNIKNIVVLVLLPMALWVAVFNSGLHATLAGVIFGILIPKKYLENSVHAFSPYVNLIILPIFAFTNAGVGLHTINIEEWISNPASQGIILGLLLGKPVGILLSSFLACRLNIAKLPDKVSWMHITGVGFIAGIGFTMALFLTHLSFELSNPIYYFAKLSVLTGSILAGLVGLIILFFSKPARKR